MTYFQKIENVNEIRTHPVFARGSPETVGPPAAHACRSDGRSSARSWGAPPLGVLLHGRGPRAQGGTEPEGPRGLGNRRRRVWAPVPPGRGARRLGPLYQPRRDEASRGVALRQEVTDQGQGRGGDQEAERETGGETESGTATDGQTDGACGGRASEVLPSRRGDEVPSSGGGASSLHITGRLGAAWGRCPSDPRGARSSGELRRLL